MYLYRQPELLNHDKHGDLGLSRPERPFDFARSARVLPLTLSEIPRAQMYYPIVFSDLENPVPLAVVGANDNVNLFVEEDGQWAAGAYVPAYVRAYPFGLAAGVNERFAVVIDRAADMVSNSPEQPFFEGGKVTSQTQAMIDFCGQYDAERRTTLQFGSKLAELGLLAHLAATRGSEAGKRETVADYIAVDSGNLAELGAEKLAELLKNGYLACVFAHLFSLENWPRIAERHAVRNAARKA